MSFCHCFWRKGKRKRREPLHCSREARSHSLCSPQARLWATQWCIVWIEAKESKNPSLGSGTAFHSLSMISNEISDGSLLVLMRVFACLSSKTRLWKGFRMWLWHLVTIMAFISLQAIFFCVYGGVFFNQKFRTFRMYNYQWWLLYYR